MKKAILFAALVMVNIGFAAATITETNESRCEGGCSEEKAYAQVCVKNFGTGFNMGVLTTWGLDKSKHLSWIPQGTEMIYRLVLPEQSETAVFEITHAAQTGSNESATKALEFMWSTDDSLTCADMPSYEFKTAIGENAVYFELVKTEAPQR